MEKLKRPNRIPSSDDDRSASTLSASKQKRSAFLDSEEIDDTSWLIDDVGPEKKKRRFHTPTKESRSSTGFRHASSSKENLFLNSLEPEVDAFQMLRQAATTSSSNSQIHSKKSTNKLSLGRSSSFANKTSSHKQQSSLLSSGFCRFRSESPTLSSEDSRDGCSSANTNNSFNIRAEPDSTTTSIHLVISPAKSSPVKVQTTPIISTTISFKVKVEDELLLVPVERKKLQDVNMRWLAEEAARRYYK